MLGPMHAGLLQAVKQALHRRRVRLESEGKAAPKAAQMLHYVIHVSPDSRKARSAAHCSFLLCLTSTGALLSS